MTPTPNFTPVNPAYYAPAIAAANHAESVQDTSSIDPDDVALPIVVGGIVLFTLIAIGCWLSYRAEKRHWRK